MDSYFERIRFHRDRAMFAHRSLATEPMKGYYHYHPGLELLFVHRGVGNIIVNRRAYALAPGQLYCFQPFQLHIVHPEASAEQPYERTIIQFDPVALDRYAAAFPDIQAYFHYLWKRELPEHCFDMTERFELLSQLSAAFKGTGRKEDEQADMLLLLQFVSAIRQLHGKKGAERTAAPRPLRYSESIMEWMEAHYAETFELDRLADALHLSKNYVSRVFREETGGSLTDYITARRMKEACKLLQTTDWAVERIGSEVGLPNASYFSQSFKRDVGTSPLQYRRRFRGARDA